MTKRLPSDRFCAFRTWIWLHITFALTDFIFFGDPGVEGARGKGEQGLSVKRPYQPMLLLR